jgi:hypothetical protein
MFERFKKSSGDTDRYREPGAVSTADRPVGAADRPLTSDPAADEGRFTRDGDTVVPRRENVRDVRARQREEFGGLNWGAAFFGWLVAVGIAVILLGLLSAAGTAFSLSEVSESEANSNAETIGIIGGILLILVLGIAYYCGGYVSGRMSRFDGGRQGFGTWAIGLAVTIVLAVAGAIFGSEYNIFESLNLPRIPIEEGSLTTGAAIALVAILVLTLLAAMGGGKAGERYHKKIDRYGYDA